MSPKGQAHPLSATTPLPWAIPTSVQRGGGRRQGQAPSPALEGVLCGGRTQRSPWLTWRGDWGYLFLEAEFMDIPEAEGPSIIPFGTRPFL